MDAKLGFGAPGERLMERDSYEALKTLKCSEPCSHTGVGG